MGSSTYRMDMDYLLVCIVSRQSGVSVPHLKRKKKKKKKKLALKNFLFIWNTTVCAWRVMFGETLFIKSIFRVIP